MSKHYTSQCPQTGRRAREALEMHPGAFAKCFMATYGPNIMLRSLYESKWVLVLDFRISKSTGIENESRSRKHGSLQMP